MVPSVGHSRYILFVASLYLLLTLVLDAARVRTFAIVGSGATSPFFLGSFLAQYACRFLSLATLSFPSLFVSKHESGLEDAGFLSHVFVFWAVPLLWMGRHGNLELEHLPKLDSDMDTTVLYSRFEVYWKAERCAPPLLHLISLCVRSYFGLELSTATTRPSRALWRPRSIPPSSGRSCRPSSARSRKLSSRSW